MDTFRNFLLAGCTSNAGSSGQTISLLVHLLSCMIQDWFLFSWAVENKIQVIKIWQGYFKFHFFEIHQLTDSTLTDIITPLFSPIFPANS